MQISELDDFIAKTITNRVDPEYCYVLYKLHNCGMWKIDKSEESARILGYIDMCYGWLSKSVSGNYFDTHFVNSLFDNERKFNFKAEIHQKMLLKYVNNWFNYYSLTEIQEWRIIETLKSIGFNDVVMISDLKKHQNVEISGYWNELININVLSLRENRLFRVVDDIYKFIMKNRAKEFSDSKSEIALMVRNHEYSTACLLFDIFTKRQYSNKFRFLLFQTKLLFTEKNNKETVFVIAR